MRKVIVGAQVSMDGVMQAPGLPTEDPTNGFRFGGWVMPYADQEFGEEIDPHPPERLKEMKDALARMAAEGDMKIID